MKNVWLLSLFCACISLQANKSILLSSSRAITPEEVRTSPVKACNLRELLYPVDNGTEAQNQFEKAYKTYAQVFDTYFKARTQQAREAIIAALVHNRGLFSGMDTFKHALATHIGRTKALNSSCCTTVSPFKGYKKAIIALADEANEKYLQSQEVAQHQQQVYRQQLQVPQRVHRRTSPRSARRILNFEFAQGECCLPGQVND